MAALRPSPSTAGSQRQRHGPILVTPDPTAGDELEPTVVNGDGAGIEVAVGGRLAVRLDGGRRVNGHAAWVRDARGGPAVEVELDGWRFVFRVEDADRAALRARASRTSASAVGTATLPIRTPIPGRIVSVDVAPGDPVESGQRLLVVEAMKMQNEVRAPRSGSIVRVDVAAGQAVEAGAVLVLIE
ncbi:MAG TPA: biotin/lipoyl-containing protein [Candidatus Limnocylindrales bacterium]|nr:biotin/lipoyl-containing protein [Candidatus Limnocylindrales bacterium]